MWQHHHNDNMERQFILQFCIHTQSNITWTVIHRDTQTHKDTTNGVNPFQSYSTTHKTEGNGKCKYISNGIKSHHHITVSIWLEMVKMEKME